ncbi:MAG: hypothetical protein KDC67_09900 [Ignavibacteriae bacterium]|nr:hypothetical protein [Ignavibacteriota bacterium]
MTKEEINKSVLQALRYEFDSQKTSKVRKIEIVKTTAKFDDYDDAFEMISDLQVDGLINQTEVNKLESELKRY